MQKAYILRADKGWTVGKRKSGLGKDGEQAFLADYDPDRYERPSVAVDVALLSAFDGALYTLVTRRAAHPFKGRWALPGGFVGMRESLEKAAERVLVRATKLRS